ncbi:MAG TPA: outer membrane beta-barrel domain-containing protein [Myxococcaceae bacterium]|nr:outer membrane beta-barrel domain-containing protein [Myxococcaceae bacterium]
MRQLLQVCMLLLPVVAFAQTEGTQSTDSAAAPEAAPPAAAERPRREPEPVREDAEIEAGDVAEIDKDARSPLRERIPPVSGQLYVLEGRFEIAPTASVTFRDAFYRKYILGGSLTYYPKQWLGISLNGGYAIPTVAGTAQICDTQTGGGCAPPTLESLEGRAPGHLLLLGGLDVMWSPIYGKLSLLSEAFAHFDLYLIGGVAAVQYGAARQTEPTPTFTVGANVGVGGHVHLNRFIALRLELRDLIYVEDTGPTGNVLNNQFMFNLGLSFFLPTSVEAR